MRAIFTGDIHLGQGKQIANDRLADQEDVLVDTADLAVRHGVDVVIVGGDVFEGPIVSPSQEAVFARFIEACRGANIPVIVALGNGRHDLAMQPDSALSIFHHVPGVTVFDRPDLTVIGDTAICVLPWTPVSRLIADRDGGDRAEVHADAADLLLTIARDLAAVADTRVRHKVLVPHWSISGAALPNGLAVDTYASEPILPLTALEDLGFDVILAAHIHRAQLLGSVFNGEIVPEPNVALYNFPVLYAGSPMPLNFGETGYPHGVWLIETGAEGPGGSGVAQTFLPIESRPLVTVDVDLTTEASADLDLDETDVIAAAIFARHLLTEAVVRIKFRATEEQARRIDWPAIHRLLDNAGIHKLHGIVPDIVRESRARVEALDESLTDPELLAAWMDANGVDDTGRRDRALDRLAKHLQAVGS